jgi:hypothetical protein
MSKLSFLLVAVLFGKFNFVSAQGMAGAAALPRILVYKTKKDYRKYVPVLLSSDKKSLVSYPDPTDAPGDAMPVKLHKGYLLDRRGVGWNTAFIKLSYDEYGKLKSVPTPEELYGMIVDKNPLTELYDCGVRRPEKDQVSRINRIIDEGKIKKKCASINKGLKK